MPKVKWAAKSIPGHVAINGERTHYSFEGVEGLVLDCLGDGTRRWKCRYEIMIDGKRQGRKQTLGTFDPEAQRNTKDQDGLDYLSPGDAKERAATLLSKVRAGGDPWLEAKVARTTVPEKTMTVEDAFKAYLDDPSREKALRPRTRAEYQRTFDAHIKSRLGAIDIKALSRDAIAKALEEIRVATTNPEKGHRGLQATKCLAIISATCNTVFGKGMIPFNPAHGIRRPVPVRNPNGKAHRPLTDAELRLVWHATPEHLSPHSARLVRLSMLIGKRISEMCNALQSEVSFDPPRLLIPAEREGNKSREDYFVPLPPLALLILQEAITESSAAEPTGKSRFVFRMRGRTDGPVSRHTASQEFVALLVTLGIRSGGDDDDNADTVVAGKSPAKKGQAGAAVPPAATERKPRFHDARGLIIDQMSLLGVPSEYRSHVLQHTGDMRESLANSTYSSFDFEPQKRRALELWEKRLLEIVEGRPASGLQW